jgi:hypothetical protein
MRRHFVFTFSHYCVACFAIVVLFSGCGGGGGGGGDGGGLTASSSGTTGTFSLNVTDAKPLLPDDTKEVLITFEEVDVHKTGEGWTSLPLAQEPFTIDLLQFQEGKTTELVPPVSLESGKYTQIRIVVSSAELITSAAGHSMVVPSESIKTDTPFDFEVKGGGAVNLTVDFDLSRSVEVTGGNLPSYKLKPVLHISHTEEAATIHGEISDVTFDAYTSTEAFVRVMWDKDPVGTVDAGDEVYTKVVVPKNDPPAAAFSIFWLVPDKDYIVQIDMDEPPDDNYEFKKTVASSYLTAGSHYHLGLF